jgi:flavin-dependent dehydrogenase
VYEAALSSGLAAAPGVTVRRGVGVAGLLAGEPVAGVPHVVGVRTEAGEELRADLVVDASGRRSPLPRWLDELGAGAPEEELEDSGFCYYGRYFRSADGSVPFAFGPPLMHHGSYSVLTLPADNGTWGVGITTMGDDAPMRALKDPEVWARLIAATPLVAHWADGEPIDDGVMIMAKLDDRHRRYVVDGRPVATGVLAVGDSWACTNPSVGRGATIGGLHAAALRDVLRDVGTADPLALALAFDAATQQVVEPLFRSTLHYDRHRLGAMRAAREGVPYEPGDPVWDLTCAMEQGASHDPDVLRAFVAVQSLVAQPEELLGDAALLERVIAVGTSEAAQEPLPGPDRAGVLEIVGAA